jgi:hypothetical protein
MRGHLERRKPWFVALYCRQERFVHSINMGVRRWLNGRRVS